MHDDVAVRRGRGAAEAADGFGGERRAGAGLGSRLPHGADTEQQDGDADRGEDGNLQPGHAHEPMVGAIGARVGRRASRNVAGG